MNEERSFKLSLPISVRGKDYFGNGFKENTILSLISCQKAIFRLESRVKINSRLELTLSVPKTYLLERPIKIFLSGVVSNIEDLRSSGKQSLIFVELDKKYKIQTLH